MPPPEAEILVQIRKVQADLFPALPAEIELTAQDVTAVQIRVHLLRARLELSPAQEQSPLALAQLLALLVELVGHADELSGALAARQPTADASTALRSMRDALLSGEVLALRAVLAGQRRALASPAVPVDGSETPET